MQCICLVYLNWIWNKIIFMIFIRKKFQNLFDYVADILPITKENSRECACIECSFSRTFKQSHLEGACEESIAMYERCECCWHVQLGFRIRK